MRKLVRDLFTWVVLLCVLSLFVSNISTLSHATTSLVALPALPMGAGDTKSG
jgi:hypothetical protein